MNAKHVPFPSSGHNDPANTEDAVPDSHGFIANLQRIGAGASSDGHPWPEPNCRLADASSWPMPIAPLPGYASCMK